MAPFENSVDIFLQYLVSHAIRTRDIDDLRRKLLIIQAEGVEKFQVISDFDKTLTPQWLTAPCSSTGALVHCSSSYAVVEKSCLLSSEYRQKTKELADYFLPLEHDHRLSEEERVKVNQDWYTQAHACMMKEDVTFTKLGEIIKHSWTNMEVHLRKNTPEFFCALEKNRIPITVLSAGLRDVIENILVLEQILPSVSAFEDDETDAMIMVVGNRLRFDSEGRHVGISDPPIMAHNKRNAVSRFLEKSEIRACRPNALLMGDLVSDVDFVHSIPKLKEFVTIGFLADRPALHEEALAEFLKHFDIVITGGAASMDAATHLIRSLFN